MNTSLRSVALFFLAVYFLIAFMPYRYDFLNSFLPGQLIPLVLFSVLSLLLVKKTFKKSNIDLIVIFLLFLFIFFNAIIQAIYQEDLLRYRITSTVASLLPLVFFFIVFFHDFNDKYIKTITMCLFIAALIYATYYAFNFYNIRFGDSSLLENVFDSQTRVVGQRDSIYLSFAFLIAVLKNYHFTRLEIIIGIWIICCCLFVITFSQTRLGYVIFLINFSLLFFVYKKYFIFILIPSLIVGSFYFSNYFASIGDVYSLSASDDANQFAYSYARFKTMVVSSLAFISSGNILDGSIEIRTITWSKILDYVLSSPLKFLFGSGELGVHALNFSYLTSDPSYKSGDIRISVLNSESQYFDTLFRRGFIGIIFLFTIIYRILYLSKYLIKFDKNYKDLYLTFYFGFIGTSFAFIFLPLLRDRTFVLFFFVAYALLSSRAYIISSQREP